MSETAKTPRQVKKAEANRRYRSARAAAKPKAAPTMSVPAGGGQTACLVYYRIPSRAKYPNPSRLFRRIGFRVDGSVWVVPQHAVPHALMNELRTKAGAEVGTVKFDAGEWGQLVRVCVKNTREAIEAQLERCRSRIETIDGQYLADTQDDKERRRAASVYRHQAEFVLGQLEALLDDTDSAVRGFEIDPNRLGIDHVRAAYDELQLKWKTRAAAYAAATQALRDAQTADAQALARGAAADRVPAYAMSDALRDAEKDGDADKLDAAFAPDAPAALGEYSLVDGE